MWILWIAASYDVARSHPSDRHRRVEIKPHRHGSISSLHHGFDSCECGWAHDLRPSIVLALSEAPN